MSNTMIVFTNLMGFLAFIYLVVHIIKLKDKVQSLDCKVHNLGIKLIELNNRVKDGIGR